MSDLDLWQQAIPLQQALTTFAPQDLVAELAANPMIDLATVAAPLAGVQTKDLAAAMATITARLNQASDGHWHARRKIEQSVLQKVRAGELLLLGFEAPRTIRSLPVRVPAHLLTVLPDWDAGTYRHEGFALVELRLIEASLAGAPPAGEDLKPAGRPSFRAEILQAYETLCAEGRFVEKPLSKGIVQVRAWIKQNLPDTKAAQGLLSDDTIRNAIKDKHSEPDGKPRE